MAEKKNILIDANDLKQETALNTETLHTQIVTDTLTGDHTDDLVQSFEHMMELGQGLDDEDYKAELVVQHNDPNSNLYAAVDFETLNLPEPLLKGIYDMKFLRPSTIQSVALPLILATPPENIIGQAQSGSGKTATFALGMLFRIDRTVHSPQALCLAPTRELARQILAVVKVMGKYCGVTYFLAIPGNEIRRGEKCTKQIVVGTPGKIEFLMKTKCIDTNHIKILVLDEADYMVAEGGMRDRSMTIKKHIRNKNLQILLFSATYADDVRDFAQRMVPDHNLITVKKEKLSLEGIKQYWIQTPTDDIRHTLLSDIFSLLSVGKAVIFAQTREMCRKLADIMRNRNHSVGLLHGADMERSIRDKIIDEFRTGITKILITTNVLARGIDVQGISLVVNYELPTNRDGSADLETYLHRIGRTGRFGRKGCAINFINNNNDRRILKTIEEHYAKPILELPADDPEQLEKIVKGSL